MVEIDWQILTTAGNQPEAELLKQRLEANDIPVMLKPGDASAYLGASGPYAIKVPAAKIDDAKRIFSS